MTTLVVLRETRRYTSSGLSHEPYDFSTRIKPTLKVRSGSTFVDVTGAQTAMGRYEFTSIPTGQRYVTFDTTTLIDPPSPVDLSVAVIGRANVAQSDGGISLTLNTTGLQFWTPLSEFQLMAPNANAFGFHAEAGLQTMLDAGVVPGPQLDFNYNGYFSVWYSSPLAPRIDATAGDVTYFAQLVSSTPNSSTPDGGTSWFLSVSVGGETSLSLPDRMTTTASVTLSNANQSGFFTEWHRESFWAYLNAINPNLVTSTSDEMFDLSAVPFTADEGLFWSTPDLVVLRNRGANFGSLITPSIPYVNPYPASWPLALSSSTCFSTIPLPVNDGGLSITGCLGQTNLASASASGVTATLSPPPFLSFDGEQKYGDRPLASLTPLISWQAPVLGTPKAYIVTVNKVTGSGVNVKSVFVTRFMTAGLSLATPPGVFSSGEVYVVKVTASSHTFDDLAFPFRFGFPEAWADGVSGLLHAP